jgi:haloacetate dehalogenase
MDTADKDRQIGMPAIVLWGARGQSPARSKEFLDVWKKFATNLESGEAMDCGHYMAEDIPDIMYDKFTKFLVG